MAKKKKLDDLEAELAALEAELQALEGKATKAAPAKAAPAKAAPAKEAPEAAPAKDEAPAEKPKSRFSLPKLGKNAGTKSAPAADEPQPVTEAAAPAPAPSPSRNVPVLPAGDLTHWRQESGAWVRRVPTHESPIVRRILDDEGRTIREEPATQADLDEVRGLKAERGVGRILGGAGSAAAKLKTLRFGRKGGSE